MSAPEASHPLVADPIEARLAQAGLPALDRLAWLEIDLEALRGNLAALREAAGPGVRVEPVVKADGYGHGAIEVSRTLAAAGADGLCVATLDEALELRAAGVELPLLVLYPIPPGSVARAAAARIAVSLGPGEPSDGMLAAAAGLATPLEVHVEIETGLGRGGVLPGDAADTIRRVAAAPGVRLGGAWSHLTSADDATMSRAQDRAFGGAIEALDGIAWGAEAVRRHLAGSGGILSGDLARHDAVRPGISLYGLLPGGVVPSPANAVAAARIRPILALKARPVRVLELPAGHGVGYGATWVTQRPTRIATLPVGYGDGWRRALSGRAEALVRGVRVPLVGRVTMDGIMADVSAVPVPPVTANDEFVLIGEQGDARITADELAATCGTISHEIVVGMSRRLARVYHAAGPVVAARTLAGGGS